MIPHQVNLRLDDWYLLLALSMVDYDSPSGQPKTCLKYGRLWVNLRLDDDSPSGQALP